MQAMSMATAVLASTSAAVLATCAASAQVLSVNGSPVTSAAGSEIAREVTLTVDLAGFAGAVGAQATIAYDPALLEFIDILGGDDFDTIIFSSHDTAASKVLFASGVNPGSGSTTGIASGNVAKILFRTIAGACLDADAVSFSTSVLVTRVTNGGGVSLPFSTANNVRVTSLAPFALSGTPAAVSVAADAGTTAGALVALTSPTAADSCGSPLSVSATRSDGAPISARFPVGTTTVTFTAVDAAGNSDSDAVAVTVANHQLLDATVALNGALQGSSQRQVRITAGTSVQVVPVSFAGGVGTAAGVQVPVASGYPCVAAKDSGHSVSSTAAASVLGTRYAASFALVQGDSNDDNLIDILDYGLFVDRYGLSSPGGLSNFNDDGVVNNNDFSFIAIGYAGTGSGCGAFTAGTPRTSVPVKELRRLGLGHLAVADLDRDGVLGEADIAAYLQHGAPVRRSDSPTGR